MLLFEVFFLWGHAGHAIEKRERGKGRRFLWAQRKDFFSPSAVDFFFSTSVVNFSSGCTAQSIRVVLSLFITRDFEILREKRTSSNRFVRSSAFFPHAFPLWRFTE